MIQTRKLFAALLAACLLATAPASPAWAATPRGDANLPQDSTAITVGATATKLLADPTDGTRRQGFLIQPVGGDIVVGGSIVTTSSGITLYAGQTMWIDSSYGGSWYAIRAGGSDVPTHILPVY